MSISIITQFKTKPGRADDLIALIRKLLPESLQQAGCEEVAIRQNQDEPDDIISAQKWASRRHYEDYMAWRTQNGVTAQFQELLTDDLQVRYFNDVPMQAAAAVHTRPGTAAHTHHSHKPHTLHREIPKISTSDAPGG
jgi:quinol monooxygenase YgiN